MKWIYNKQFNPEDYWGFVYKITDLTTDNFYIGSKSFFSRTNPKISKKRSNELYLGKGRKPTREKKIKISNWEEYTSSSKDVQELIKLNENNFKFEILELFKTKQHMLLYEAHLIIKEFLNMNDKILNKWVSIKAFKLK